ELSDGDQPAAIETFLANHKAVFGLGSLETPVVSRTQDSALGRVYHLDRGYERLEDKLSGAGIDIERVRFDEWADPS
ncbi:MAG: hypothetical protein EBR20_06390, partial [Bacteroidetes bacterium]|nr:hypothetical protein [Bacteroidota bacterium]